jgi:hypothetical protein
MPIDRGYALAMINVEVWSGLRSPKEIERIVLDDCFLPEDITDAVLLLPLAGYSDCHHGVDHLRDVAHAGRDKPPSRFNAGLRRY